MEKGQAEVELLEITSEDKEKPALWRRITGIGFVLIIVKNLVGGVNDILVKSLSEVHPITLLLLRSLFTLAIITPVSIARDEPPFPAGYSLQDRALLVFRCVIGCIQVHLVICASILLPAIGSLTDTFWVTPTAILPLPR